MPFILVGLALLAGGLLLFFIRRRSAAMQAASVSWPTAPATVTAAELKSYRDRDNRNLHNYYADVRYAYQVGGTDYTGSRVSWGGRQVSPSPDQANGILARYPVGGTVPVHYNPQKPSKSVLEPQEKGGLKNLTFIMAIFFVLAAIFIVIGFFVQG